MSNTLLPDGSRVVFHEVLEDTVKGVRELRGKRFQFTTTRKNWDKLLHLSYANSEGSPALRVVQAE